MDIWETSIAEKNISNPSGRESMMISIFIVFAVFILFYVNKMTNSLCIQKEIPEENQHKVFRTINVLITILLISSYLEILYT